MREQWHIYWLTRKRKESWSVWYANGIWIINTSIEREFNAIYWASFVSISIYWYIYSLCKLSMCLIDLEFLIHSSSYTPTHMVTNYWWVLCYAYMKCVYLIRVMMPLGISKLFVSHKYLCVYKLGVGYQMMFVYYLC